MHGAERDMERDWVRGLLTIKNSNFICVCLGSFGCINKIKSLPSEGQYHGCPFKHQKNLKGQLRSWGIQKDDDVAEIAKMATAGKYQVFVNYVTSYVKRTFLFKARVYLLL